VTAEGPKSATLEVSLTAKLPSAPMFSRPEPKVLEILLPGARIGDPRPLTFETPSVESLERIQEARGVTLRLHLVRPMGIELSHSGSDVDIVLVKPQVGDGRLAGKVVVVDAGHGGDDTGARSPDKSVNEKDLTLAIAKLLTTQLAHEGATVIMTRKTDVRIPLKERSEVANRNLADFFVSVHINSNTVANRTSGGITFFHKQDPLGRLLADCIQGEIAKVSGIPNMGTWSDQRIYDSGFAVLRYSQMPAVLLELGFINHSFDRKRMRTAEFQQAVAKAVVRGLKVYLGNE
jgi:N-acetylmuramoyl-L-alanine amidase